MSQELQASFPELGHTPYEITSPITPLYNCIAHAADDDTKWWWPSSDSYWPAAGCDDSVDSFVHTFCQFLGYEICADGKLEEGFLKVAIYAISGQTKHMARQLPDGSWTSKLGKHHDISHTLQGLEGTTYGSVAAYLRRRKI
jgi:hypothetical protein